MVRIVVVFVGALVVAAGITTASTAGEVRTDSPPDTAPLVTALVDGRPTDRARAAHFSTETPGIVRVEEWRQDPAASGAGRSSLWCGVGRKV